LKTIPEVFASYARAGGEEDDAFYLADARERREILHVKVLLAQRRGRSASAVAALIRGMLRVEGASVAVDLPESVVAPLLGVQSDSLLLKVEGGDQAEALRRLAEVRAIVRQRLPGADVSVSPEGEKPGLHLIPDRPAIAMTGSSLLDLAQAVRGALEGTVATRITVGGREMDVRVQLRPEDSGDQKRLEALVVRGPQGAALRVGDLARLSFVAETPMLVREDRADAAYVRIGRAGGASGGAAGEAARLGAFLTRELGFVESKETSILRENIRLLVLTFCLVIVLLYLVLGIQFESFILPLLLLLSLPLSFFGIFTALFLAGKSLNFDSILGIVVLFGIAVNNSIVLYENYRERALRIRRGGLLVAVYRGTAERLRPILITMLCTAMALVPTAIDPLQTSTQSSMAIAIIGGLFVSTTLTLFVIPRLFLGFLRRGRGSP
jgi:HAE1 family hydrophobic/amphiphilic exporter-1